MTTTDASHTPARIFAGNNLRASGVTWNHRMIPLFEDKLF